MPLHRHILYHILKFVPMTDLVRSVTALGRERLKLFSLVWCNGNERIRQSLLVGLDPARFESRLIATPELCAAHTVSVGSATLYRFLVADLPPKGNQAMLSLGFRLITPGLSERDRLVLSVTEFDELVIDTRRAGGVVSVIRAAGAGCAETKELQCGRFVIPRGREDFLYLKIVRPD